VARREQTVSGFKSPDDVDTADGIPTLPDIPDDEEQVGDDDTETSFTALEHHMFGERYFEENQGLGEHGDLTTMLHRKPSDADTMLQRSLHAPPPVQVVTILPEGARPVPVGMPPDGSLPGATPAPSGDPALRARPQGQLIAAGGVFAGFSFVAAGSLIGLALVLAVGLILLFRSPRIEAMPPIAAPGTVEPPTGGAPPSPAPPAATIPPELLAGVRFPATFGFDDWRVRDLDAEALDALVNLLGQCTGPIGVTGHTDARGGDLVNDRIAIARAGEVRRILEAHGIDRKRIEVASAGAASPEADDDSRESRAQNRRVTVRCR
jgi:hypothetical protein